LDRLVGHVAVDEQPASSARLRQLPRDVVEVVDGVTVEIANRDLAVVDEGEDAEAGPERLHDRVVDLAESSLAEPLGPPVGGRRADVDRPHELLRGAHGEILQRVGQRVGAGAVQRPRGPRVTVQWPL
jgi:hypothetical protein